MEPSEKHPRHFANRCHFEDVADLLDFAEEIGLEVIGAPVYVGKRPRHSDDRDWIVWTRGGPLISPASRGAFSFA